MSVEAREGKDTEWEGMVGQAVLKEKHVSFEPSHCSYMALCHNSGRSLRRQGPLWEDVSKYTENAHASEDVPVNRASRQLPIESPSDRRPEPASHLAPATEALSVI